MAKARELRIGSLVQAPVAGGKQEVVGLVQVIGRHGTITVRTGLSPSALSQCSLERAAVVNTSGFTPEQTLQFEMICRAMRAEQIL